MTRFFLALTFLLCPSLAKAVVVAPGTTDSVQCTSSTTSSYSETFNIPTGSDLVAVVNLSWGNNDNGNNNISVSTITLGGTNILSDAANAAVNSNTSGYYGWIQNYVVPAPVTGASVTLAYTVSATPYRLCANIVTFTGVNQTTPIRPGTFKTANVSNVSGGLISLLIPSRIGDLVFSTFNASTSLLTGNQTTAGSSSSNATGYGYWGNAYQTTTSPQLLFVWGNAGASNYVVQTAFSLQSITNSVVLHYLNGVQPGVFPGQYQKRSGTAIGSAISGYLTQVGTLASPSGTSLINYFFNPSLGGTAGNAPTTATLGNSYTGDYDYHTWTISGMGAGMTYSNASSPPSNLLVPVSDNGSATNTATGSLGLGCTTSTTGDNCSALYDIDANLGPSTTMGYWIYSTCTGATQDCGAQFGLSDSTGSHDGLGLHIDGVTPCSYNGFSIDPGTNSGCLTGAYHPSTWYRINVQMNEGEANFTATFSPSTPSITATQTLAANQAVTISNAGGSLPTGLTAATPYYVLSQGLSGSAFQLAATQGGKPIQVTSAGSGTNTFQVIHQMTICNANGALVGTLYIPSATTAYLPGRVVYGVNGEEPTVSGYNYRWYGVAIDGTGKFSNTECVL